jgi:hypothetical protein
MKESAERYRNEEILNMAVWIKDAEGVAPWDEGAKQHVYLEGGDVVFEGSAITFVGRIHAGAVDEIAPLSLALR